MATRDETKPCCPGSIPKDYACVGEEVTLEGDLKVYVSAKNVDTTKPVRAVLVSYDIFGFNAGGTREFCDKLAAAGFAVAMPDYFRGNPWPEDNFPPKEGFDGFMTWVNGFSNESLATDVEVTRKHLIEKYNAQNIGLVSFCFGGKVAIPAATTGNFKACVSCHGSLLNEEDGPKIQCPVLFMDAGSDPSRDPFMDALKAKPFGAECQAIKYDDMEHGWTIRGDRSNARVKECMDEAYAKAQAYLEKHVC